MSRELLNVNNTDTIKQNDDSTTIILSAHDDNEPKIFKPGDIGTIHISTSQYHIPSIPAKLIVGSNNVNINSTDLVSLPAGEYSLELWVSQKDGPKTTIYPSSGSLVLTIDNNADDLTDKTLTTLTLDDLRKDLHADVADAVKHVKIDPASLDLSDYAKKADVPTVTLDVDKRTLTINKQIINIPNSVDLSGYAKSDQVPDVKYNAQTKTLTVNGVTVEIPSNIDLSNYYTKDQVNQQIKENKTTVDLTDYVKTGDLTPYIKAVDADAKYATKSEIPDLSGYAKKSDIKPVDLTPYVKTVDADAKYATKADVANVEKQPGTPGKDGKRGPVIWQTSQPLNTRGGSYSIPISTLTSDVSNVTPAVGDVIIASSDQGSSYALLISSVDSNNVNFTSTIKLSGDNGSNGHSVWAYGSSAGNITTPTSSLLNYDGSREPDYGDLVIGNDGSISEITNVDISSQTITIGKVGYLE